MDNTDGFIISSPKTPCAQELFPCPFCDTIPELVDRPHGSCIRCPVCGAMIARDLCSEIPDTKQAVIDAWNSRVHYNNIETCQFCLKPCPFCGSEAVIEQIDEGCNDEWCIYCLNSDGECKMQPCTKIYETQEDAIEAWNTRADFQKTCIFTYDEDLHYWECSECEGTLFFSPDSPNSPKDNGYRYCPFCGRKIIKEVRNYE